MVQVPAATPVTVEPLTVQTFGVVLVKVTPRADGVALADAVVVPPTLRVAGLKLMLPMAWEALSTRMETFTWLAGLKLLLPA